MIQFAEMYNNPKSYFNSTEPPNVTGVPSFTSLFGGKGADSYLWGDSLHPSEQTGRNVAKEYVNVVTGKSKYATYFS
jgi:hypothetical protein